ncbi:S-adenosyl-L-methionine-dependent methyltransferase [Pseudomassariella vexata]|uniref:tRNA (uracil(54)-C(5))-methyltransferase n=1 Tax=Pseudomassariella vexata TaxID=1141098 RepID=A0A1Y2DL50_9PEZI|nr:S-adenosyl-L-methionine-dependent methyltransferase [Pseudomassariella vexata]ORY59962.1 S-adenosyl-L-methionine-dependent methyltransferase [Pseudomassariella vexata]
MRLHQAIFSHLVTRGRPLITPFVRYRPFTAMASPAVLIPSEFMCDPGAPAQSVQKQQNGPQHNGQQHNGQQRKQGKRPFQQANQNHKKSKKLRKRERDMQSGSHEDVLALDIQALKLANESVGDETEYILPEQGSEIEVEVLELSSTGDGLARQKGSKEIYVVPFAVPGDTLKVRAYRQLKDEGYTVADFLSVVKPSPMRDDSRINCKYFATCSGCQFQSMDYADQLQHKKRIVEKAFKNFSQLPPELIPAIQDTIGSPLQYGYRTKLTPHFDGPQGWKRTKEPFKSKPAVGFMPKGKRTTMDIEDCPIGTDAVRMGMKTEQARMEVEFNKYTRGATILLRESTERIPKDASPPRPATPTDAIKVESEPYTDLKTCITDNNATSTEYIGDYIFSNPAGSFFQNNNSILPPFTDYIRQHILPPSTPVKYLIDAYSGSGLFTITLASLFQGSTGIDIAEKSIEFARTNARANNLPESQCNFIAADAGELFKSVTYPADETVVVLDPPRKGCDASFLGQLLRFGPKRVVYVSCNVHTQARDVGMLVRGETGVPTDGAAGGSHKKKVRYEIESLRGFDFFPQTGHVEGVAVLNRGEIAADDIDANDDATAKVEDNASAAVQAEAEAMEATLM